MGVFRKDLTDNLITALRLLERSAPIKNSPLIVWREFSQKNFLCFFESLGLNLENLRFSAKEMQELTAYFYILEMMVRCKKAAVRVSPRVWEGIESRMVTIPTE